MRIAFASDHAGFVQKDILEHYCRERGHEVIDLGPDTGENSVDYPDYAKAVGTALQDGTADRGVLVCGTGIGMCMAVDKMRGIRAANITDPEFMKLARQHNNANVVTLSGRFIAPETNEKILDIFLNTPFEGGRHQRRVDGITELETAALETAALEDAQN